MTCCSVPCDTLTNALCQADLWDEAQLAARPADHEAILTGYLLQSKAHDRWRVLHARQVAYRLSSRTQSESKAVGKVPPGRRYTQLPGDGVEVVTLSDRLVVDQQVGSAKRLVYFAG
jgi:hypothetical protein